MAEKAVRKYESPLRQRQSERTRAVILDALSDLLRTHDWDGVTTKLLAERAGVAQQTVYRHFPDRAALIDALRERATNSRPRPYDGPPETLEEWATRLERGFQEADQRFMAELTASTLFNAETRRFLHRSPERSALFWAVVEHTLPGLGEWDRRRVAALMRVLGSTQTWLRMREEFGLDGAVSGELVRWAITVLLREIAAGKLPPREDDASPAASPRATAADDDWLANVVNGTDRDCGGRSWDD